MIELTNNIIHEFIGLTAEIIESTNKQIIGQSGIVMNETRNMFLLKTKFGLKQIPKDCSIWKFFANFYNFSIVRSIIFRNVWAGD